ncbi:tRNA (guanine-N1)-methyltransferase [Candidatus Woesearchaeota archaeon]|nr:tRNA (guanine-N1)-methyltransferase [Candidatus Woesearchaeota archaeon]
MAKITLKDLLKGKLTAAELQLVRSSYDVIGNIAVLDIPKELKKKEKQIAEAVQQHHKNIQTVAKRAGIHEGIYRTQKVRIILGKKTTETTHKESSALVKLDITKVYFSPRLASERLRIAHLVRPGEKILVMFSGVAVYPAVIAKNSKALIIYGIEKNPAAHRYAQETILLNKLQDRVVLKKGDVKKIAATLPLKFDRIIMPLPKDAYGYLAEAVHAAGRRCTIHYYAFGSLEQAPHIAQSIKESVNELGRPCKIMGIVKCGQYSPGIYRLCIDLNIL